MTKMTEWRKAFKDGTATEGMKLVDEFGLSVETMRGLSFRIDKMLDLVRGEERNRCFAETHTALHSALDRILTGRRK